MIIFSIFSQMNQNAVMAGCGLDSTIQWGGRKEWERYF